MTRSRGRLRSVGRYVGVAVYALVAVASSFQHHDLVCHLKSPQHCAACVATPLGNDPRTASVPAACRLADAGSADVVQPTLHRVLLAVRSNGRSPPTLS
jgi:hypothetical protein